MAPDPKNGLFLENLGILLPWGRSIERIRKNTLVRKLDRADRIEYHWGVHKVLNGLELELSNTFLKPSWRRKFTKIESWYIGDSVAKSNFARISEHLIEEFGLPDQKDEHDKREIMWRWVTEHVVLSLYLFEQHSLKLNFTIAQKKQ